MERMKKEELEKLKDFKVYAFEGDVYVKAEDYKEIAIENKKLKEDVEFFRQCYLDLKKLCEDGGFLLPNEEIAKMFNLDEIK